MAESAGHQDDRPRRAIVLGGGVCGLFATLTLIRKGIPVTLLERRPVPGGLAAGERRGGNHYDLGVHMLHAFDTEIFEAVRDVMGDERIEVELDARIRWAGGTYRYPLQFGDMVRGMPLLLFLRCATGLLFAQARYALFPEEARDAEEALVQLYGRPLYRFFFEAFTERYWGIHPAGLSATFIRTKMPRLSAVDVLKKCLSAIGIKGGNEAVESALLRETLHYSRNGAEAMPRLLAAACEDAGAEVITGASVSALTSQEGDGGGHVVEYIVSGEEVRREVETVISTVPLPSLLGMLGSSVPDRVVAAGASLQYKAIAVYGLLVRKPKVLDALYVYFRNRVFHRVGEPKNAGLVVSPPDHTILIVEMTCHEGDRKWQGSDEIVAEVFQDLEAEGVCTAEDVVECHILTAAHGYPIFAKGFEEPLEIVRSYIGSIPGLRSTGRQGGFSYPNMHQAMRMGKEAAEEVLGSLKDC